MPLLRHHSGASKRSRCVRQHSSAAMINPTPIRPPLSPAVLCVCGVPVAAAAAAASTEQDIGALVPMGFLHAVSHLTVVLGLGAGAVSFLQTVKASEACFTALLSYIFLGQVRHIFCTEYDIVVDTRGLFDSSQLLTGMVSRAPPTTTFFLFSAVPLAYFFLLFCVRVVVLNSRYDRPAKEWAWPPSLSRSHFCTTVVLISTYIREEYRYILPRGTKCLFCPCHGHDQRRSSWLQVFHKAGWK